MFGYSLRLNTSRCTPLGRVQLLLGGGLVGAGSPFPPAPGPAHGHGSDSQ